jgi:hypothetical protein
MENGLNVATSVKKGPRSYPRLNTLRQRIIFLTREFESRFNVTDLTKTEDKQLYK